MNINVTPMPEKPAAVVEPKRRTITLTNRAPIQIVEDEWPIIAQGDCGWEHPSMDGTGWSVEVRVRRGKHQTVIHAKYILTTEDEDGGQMVRVGRVLWEHEAVADLWKHMLEVGEELRSRIVNERMQKYVTFALDSCFASLKPQAF